MHIWWETGNEFERCCKRELLTEVSLKVQKLDFLAVSEKKTNSYWIKLLKGQWAVEIFFFWQSYISVYWIRSDIGQHSDVGKKPVPFRLKGTV